MKSRFSRTLLVLLMLLSASTVVQAQRFPDFTVLVEENVPAIVNVSTTRTPEATDDERQAYMEELLRYLYGDRVPQLEQPPQGNDERGATGSGFIISADGYVVTNDHVVADADSITITLNDHREFSARVVGTDSGSDLALLKIEARGLPVVKLGDSSKLKVGEWVLAIGSPFGLQYSVAAGIISYMGRSLPTDGRNYVSYIQTDVAINPGHSGGPLLNLAGEVVGINSQIFTNSGGSIGLSFAIPVDVAKNVIGQLKDKGSVQRGWLGVAYEDVSPSLAEAFALETPHGALINRVVDGSPAQDAGLKAGDIVIALNGQQVRTGADLPYFVGLMLPGTEVSMQYVRAGEVKTLNLTLGTLAPQNAQITPEPEEENRLGLKVRALNKNEQAALGLDYGVMVETAEGVAAAAEIVAGDIILTINSTEISTPEELAAVALTLPAERAFPVLVARGETQSFFTFKIPE